MASGGKLQSALEKIGRDHLECGICQERYTQPKILDCQHSFCEQCLVKLYHNTHQHKDTQEIPCPVCRRQTQLPETGIQGLKTNFYITSLAEDLAVQERLASLGDTEQLCEICEGGNQATHRCLDCAQNMCTSCSKAHLRIAALAKHTIATLDDVRQGKMPLQKQHLKCKNHPEEATRFYCTTCEELICRDCTVIDHCKPAHTHMDCNKAAATYRQSLIQLCCVLEGAHEKLMKSQETVSQVKDELQKTTEGSLAEVRARAAEMKAQLITQENRITDEIRQLQKTRCVKLDEYEETMGEMSKGIQYSLETAKDVARTASDNDFLSLYPTISKDLTYLAGRNPPAVDERLSFFKFKPSQGTGNINLGELQLKEGKWGLLREFSQMGSEPGEFSGAHGIAGLEPDEIAVADSLNKRVVICSTEGSHRSIIHVEGPRDVAANRTHDRLVICHTSSSVKVFNKDRRLAFDFFTVPLREVDKTLVSLCSVAVKANGVIVVGDVKRRVLTEHRPTDGSLIRTIPVQTAPFYIAVDSMKRLVISNWEQEVHVTDDNGATLFIIKPTIEGNQVQSCTGVYCDSSGIYVAMHNNDRGTGHIHHYDTSGKYLNCVAKGLREPRGIAFTADGQHPIVADYSSVKIYRVV